MNQNPTNLAEELKNADALINSGKAVEAEKAYAGWLAANSDTAELQAQNAHAYSGLARCLMVQNRLDESESALLQCLELSKAAHGLESRQTATALSNLARVKGRREPGQAIRYGWDAAEILEKLYGKDSPEVGTALINLSSHQYNAGDLDNAKKTIGIAMEIWCSVEGHDSVKVASCYNNLARVFEKGDDLDGGLAMHQKAYEIRKKLCGDSHVDTATSLLNMAINNFDRNNQSEALDLFKSALEVFTNAGAGECADARACRDNIERCELFIKYQAMEADSLEAEEAARLLVQEQKDREEA